MVTAVPWRRRRRRRPKSGGGNLPRLASSGRLAAAGRRSLSGSLDLAQPKPTSLLTVVHQIDIAPLPIDGGGVSSAAVFARLAHHRSVRPTDVSRRPTDGRISVSSRPNLPERKESLSSGRFYAAASAVVGRNSVMRAARGGVCWRDSGGGGGGGGEDPGERVASEGRRRLVAAAAWPFSRAKREGTSRDVTSSARRPGGSRPAAR